MAGKLKIIFDPGRPMGIHLSAESDLVTQVVEGEIAYRLGVRAGMRILAVGGRPYREDALGDAMNSNIRFEVVFVEDKLDSHVLWSSSTQSRATISRLPDGCHARLEMASSESRSAGTSDSQPSWTASSELDQAKQSWPDRSRVGSSDVSNDDPSESDVDPAIPTERKGWTDQKSQSPQHLFQPRSVY